MDGMTPLGMAVRSKRFASVNALLKRGAKVNISIYGDTLLEVAVRGDDIETCSL